MPSGRLHAVIPALGLHVREREPSSSTVDLESFEPEEVVTVATLYERNPTGAFWPTAAKRILMIMMNEFQPSMGGFRWSLRIPGSVSGVRSEKVALVKSAQLVASGSFMFFSGGLLP